VGAFVRARGRGCGRSRTARDGKYAPIVADEEHVYLTGYTRVYALAPRRG
jgi:hypothetical protein